MEDGNVDLEGQISPQQSSVNESRAHSVDLSQTSTSPTFSSSTSPQGTLSNNITPTEPSTEPVGSVVNIDKKIKFWKKFSLTLGLITFFGYILTIIGANVLAHGTQVGWLIFMMSGLAWHVLLFTLFVLSLISFIRVAVLSSRRKKHVFKDYIIVVIGLLLIFSPYAISGILSFFRISWNEDGSISVTLKSKDPYYLSGDSRWGVLNCAKIMQSTKTSNDLKNVDVNEKFSYVDSEERRKLFAARQYVRGIGEEILCQVGEFYREKGRYPNETEVKNFSSNAINDDVRAGIYNIKLEVGDEPNDKDFTILFDRNCTNKTAEDGNVVILSPLYGESGRYCVHQTIDEIQLEDSSDEET